MVNGIFLEQYETYVQLSTVNKAPNIESIIIPAPLEYVSAASRYFESYDYVEEKYENHVNDQFTSKVFRSKIYTIKCTSSCYELL